MRVTRPILGFGLLLAFGCGSEDAAAMFAGANDEGAGGAASPSPGDSSDGAGAPTAPEKEVESDYEAPVATGNYVWVANPKSGRVAFIDAKSLTVKTVEAGNEPTYLAGIPGRGSDATIVLNRLSDDATLFEVKGSAITSKTFKTAHGANAWAFSADGRWAIAWTDARKISGAVKAEGFQDLTVIDTTGAVAPKVLAVGYRPVAVGFAADGTRAHAVTQDGVSIVDLTGASPRVTRNVAISDNPLEDPGSRDVSITPDGSLAFVRRDGSSSITIVSLAAATRSQVTLDGPVTDLDLSDTGARAVAVVRSTSTVAIMNVPEIAADPTKVTKVPVAGETIGSVALAPGGDSGLFFTNAAEVERITVMRFAPLPPTFRTIRLYSPVLGVFGSPDARHAVVLHAASSPSPEGGTAPGAFSLVPTAEELPARIVAMQAPAQAVALANDRAVVSESDASRNVHGAYLARLPSLQVERYPLASPPTAVGIVAGAKRAFVAQAHPEGRITFIDLDSGQSRTLTGFELASRVVDGSTP